MSEIRLSDKVLSRIVDRVARKAKENPDTSKSTMLNIAVSEIIGPGHDWGMIKNTKDAVVSRDLRNKSMPRLEYGAIGMHAGTIPESLVTTMPLVQKEDPLFTFFRKTETLIKKEERGEEFINFIPLLLEGLILDLPDSPRVKHWQSIVDDSKKNAIESDDKVSFKKITDWFRETVSPEAMILASDVGIGKEWDGMIQSGQYRDLMVTQGKAWELWNQYGSLMNVPVLMYILDLLVRIANHREPKDRKTFTFNIQKSVSDIARCIKAMHGAEAMEDYFSKINIEELAEKLLQQSRV